MRHILIIILYTLQNNGFDTLDGGLGYATTEPKQKKKSKKKSGKRMISSQQQGHVTDPMLQSTLQQESNGFKNGSYFNNGAASQTGIQSEIKTNGAHRTHRNGSKQIPSCTASLPLTKQSNQLLMVIKVVRVLKDYLLIKFFHLTLTPCLNPVELRQ